MTRRDPLSGAAPSSVSLPRAPLVRVMAQLAFNPITKISTPDVQSVSGFQDRIRGIYPKIQQKNGQVFDFSTEGKEATFQVTQAAFWVFTDPEANYRVTLTADRLTLEAASGCYRGRSDFLTHFRVLAAAFVEEFPDVTGVHVGHRYVSQCIDDPILSNPNKYIESELVGIVAASAEWHQNIENTISRVTARTDEGHASWQWGLIPVGQTHDPLVMPPFNEKSWVLDIDSTGDIELSDILNPDVVMKKLEEVAERSYAIFRWCVKDDFLAYYGGTV